MKNPKTLQEVRRDSRVSIISDERGNGDGIWVYLVAGYRDYDFDPYHPTGTIHEQTVGAIIERFKGVRKVK